MPLAPSDFAAGPPEPRLQAIERALKFA